VSYTKTGDYPLVDIIIPHYNGKDILENCLASLEKATYPNINVCVVDNGSTDNSVIEAKKRFGGITILNPGKNLGYAGGCNYGYEKTSAKYVIFLNNDTEHEPDWITHLVDFAETHPEVAALQPKILSIQERNIGKKVFDYAGAAGGMLDCLGFPYAYGRIMDDIEEDRGQYNQPRQIFWASGAAMFLRREVTEKIGVFDEEFFAHMEEIDLCWRLQIAGYKIYNQPQSEVYHYGGATLKSGSEKKVFLNHRNNLFMILKNMEFKRLIFFFPLRLLLEVLIAFYYLLKFNFNYLKLPYKAIGWNLRHLKLILKKRDQVQFLRSVHDELLFRESKFLLFIN